VTPPPLEEIRDVLRRHGARWMALDDVVAVGIGSLQGDRHGIVVSVRSKTEEVQEAVPDSVEGVPVELRVVGDVRAQ